MRRQKIFAQHLSHKNERCTINVHRHPHSSLNFWPTAVTLICSAEYATFNLLIRASTASFLSTSDNYFNLCTLWCSSYKRCSVQRSSEICPEFFWIWLDDGDEHVSYWEILQRSAETWRPWATILILVSVWRLAHNCESVCKISEASWSEHYWAKNVRFLVWIAYKAISPPAICKTILSKHGSNKHAVHP